jgi:hypothetical protein
MTIGHKTLHRHAQMLDLGVINRLNMRYSCGCISELRRGDESWKMGREVLGHLSIVLLVYDVCVLVK